MQTNLDLDDARAQAFLEERFPGAKVLAVPLQGGMQSGECYNNVREVVRRLGGEVQLCWLLTWFPDHYIEALHHAVWRKPDGTLVDVTAQAFPDMDRASADIVLDNETTFAPVTNPAVPSRVLQLDECQGTAEFLDLLQKQMRIVAEMNAIATTIPTVTIEGQTMYTWRPPEMLALGRDLKEVNDRILKYARRFVQGQFQKLQ